MDNNYEENFQVVQSHLNIIQSVIQRMSTNSASCKAWCITLVSAILVIVADKSKPEYALISIIPILLFFILDTYYLSLEKQFRNAYNEFIQKYHSSSLKASDFFVVTPERCLSRKLSHLVKNFFEYHSCRRSFKSSAG